MTVQGAKYVWKLPNASTDTVLTIASTYNLSVPIAQTLVTRGIVSRQQLDTYLFSVLDRDVEHPSRIRDAQKAVDRIIQALEKGEKILIAGDYDVDGITSSALLLVCLLPLGANINFFLPNRVKDGYGLSVKTVERAVASGYTLIVTVDNGITAFEPARKARELGIDLIITDHHKQHDELPDAYAIVNPNRNDCGSRFKFFAGVGVIFKVLSLLYEAKGLSMPPKAYELLLLGTIADVVPLIGENRFWVRHGLQYINSVESPSLGMLKANGRITKPKLSSLDIGFSIAPQINALGRLEDARQGVRFLIGSDANEIKEVGAVLLSLNETRKEIERKIFAEIKAEIDAGMIDVAKERVILAVGTQWPPGVIGLVASRLVGMYGRPALLFHKTKDGFAKGSCRSIPAFNMFNALHDCKDLIEQFGGHVMAAGLSIKAERLPALKERLEQLAAEQLTEKDLQLSVTLDAQALLSDLTKKFIKDMDYLEPFGNENKQPLFLIKDVTLVQQPILLKDAHVKCTLFADGILKPIIFFNRPELFSRFMNQQERSFDVVAHVVENVWNGKTNIELSGVDVSRLVD